MLSRKIRHVAAAVAHKAVFLRALRAHLFATARAHAVVVKVYFPVAAKAFHFFTSAYIVAATHRFYTQRARKQKGAGHNFCDEASARRQNKSRRAAACSVVTKNSIRSVFFVSVFVERYNFAAAFNL